MNCQLVVIFHSKMRQTYVLNAVSVEVACENNVGQTTAASWVFRVLAFHAVEITIEDARVASFTKENETVGEGLEEGFDWCFNCLLCVG